jgi:hypothetical protein
MKHLIVVRVGNDDRPASEADIQAVEEAVKQAIAEGGLLVTNHYIDFQIVPIPDGAVCCGGGCGCE